ncbi:MAG: glutaredoxin family protein [Chloroflexi bacterium]|uniref:Glutaredoxin family protein n=1 Tax=Candidatus Chlorohelix allophototropha TaxID=3003348 RepID=A0A8T7M2Z7_9CHLR|nr:glutaredoxin family protein [Chloroflexota bacterium]WJW66994.1 glutaredoxin family protein [Chloroflexota bacterium L227-S17]
MKNSHKIVLYSKPGCHLCEDAKEALNSLSGEFDFILEEFDINEDSTLYERYKYTIPVMVVDGKIELEARINASKIRRAFNDGYGPTYRILKTKA